MFEQFGDTAMAVLTAAVRERWSSAADLVDAIEELAIRAAAKAEPSDDVAGELFDISRIVSGSPELELTLGSTLGDPAAKAAMVEKLLDGQASGAATLIVTELVHALRGRRVRGVLSDAIDVVAKQAGRTVATVTTARPLGSAQSERLRASLARTYGGDIALNQIIDAGVVGGIRVQIADDLIDGSLSTRLNDLRQKLAS